MVGASRVIVISNYYQLKSLAAESFRVTAFCQKRGPGRDYEFKTEAGEDIKDWVE
jgi:hypothetical protein